jgi:hypothetical protein
VPFAVNEKLLISATPPPPPPPPPSAPPPPPPPTTNTVAVEIPDGVVHAQLLEFVKVKVVKPPLETLVGEQVGKDVAETVALPPV